MSESGGPTNRDRGTVFLPTGIVFLIVAMAMILLGSTAWIAFFTMGITFLILGMGKSAGQVERPPDATAHG